MIVLTSAMAGSGPRQAIAATTGRIFFDIMLTFGLERVKGETPSAPCRSGLGWGYYRSRLPDSPCYRARQPPTQGCAQRRTIRCRVVAFRQFDASSFHPA